MNSSPMFHLRLFGSPSIAREDGALLSGRAVQRHRLALLALLALAPGRCLSREKLMAYLWPERDTEHARQLLNQAVYHLRKALGEEAILTGADDLRLNTEVIRADVAEFESALERDDQESAVALYRGPFLDGFFLSDAPEFEHWVDQERQRLADAYGMALEALAEAAEVQGDLARAMEWWRVRAAQDPYDSRVALRLMQVLEANGNRAGALQHAAIHQRLLQEEFGVEPPSELLAAAQVIEHSPGKHPAERLQNITELPPDSRAPPEASAVPIPPPERSQRMPRQWRVWHGVAALLLLLGISGLLLWRLFSGAQDPLAIGGPAMQAQRFSLAVLPLKNYSGDPAQEYFADGMTEELITTLTRIEALRVIAHQSVRQFERSEQSVPEIAQLLGVKYVVDGSVLQDGERVGITVNLIDAATSTPLWGERFERERRDVLALQREVALAIARQIEITLTPQDRARLPDAATVDPQAFDLYVRGSQARYQLTDQGLREAMEYYAQAVARDSGYAPAYAGLAWVHGFLGNGSQARRFAERALALDPTLAEPHVALGLVRQFSDWDWTGAESSFREAILLNPGYAEAHHELSMLLMRLRRFDEALREAQQTLYLAPMSARFQVGLGEVYLYAGQYDEAVAAIEKGIPLDRGYVTAHLWLAIAYGGQGRYENAVEAVTKLRGSGCSDRPPYLGYLHAVMGKRAEALEFLDRLKEEWRRREAGKPECGYAIAMVYAGLGDRNQALEWLERSAAPGHWLWSYLAVEPTFRSLHAEPRFHALLKKVGLET